MGPRPRLALLDPTRPRPGILAALLQPPQTPHLTRRPATHQPRSPRPRAGQLGGPADASAQRRELGVVDGACGVQALEARQRVARRRRPRPRRRRARMLDPLVPPAAPLTPVHPGA